MQIVLYFITGVMLGFEFYESEEVLGNTSEKGLVLDLFIIRLVFIFQKDSISE